MTNSDHNAFIGARVGSNNTGELSAIHEALLFAEQRSMQKVQINTDSKWSINVITGKWRAGGHKTLVNHIRSLLPVSNMSVSFHWVKGHSGVEGNERADKLADQGKDTQERMGGRLLTVSLPACEVSPTDHTAETFVEKLKQAAVQSFTPMTYAPRTPWIQQETLHLLEKAKQAEANLDPQAKSLRLAAKRQAKKDRVTWVHNQLMQDPVAEHSTVWQTARRQKQGFRARKQHLLVQSKPVPV